MSKRAAKRAERVLKARIANARAPVSAKAVRMGAERIPGSLNRHKTYGRSQDGRRR